MPDGDLDDVPDAAKRNSNAARFGMDVREQRKSVAAYDASIRFMDEQLGRLLNALERLDLRDSTIVVFTSDHGFNFGEHTSWQKSSLWEESVQVPLIVSLPGTRHAGARADAVVELIELYPTFAEMSGLGDDAPAILQGESLVGLLESPGEADPNGSAYTITSGGGASLRTDRFRYNRWGDNAEGGNEELYDHETDPKEHTNLAPDPAFESVLEELRAEFERKRNDARGAAAPYGSF